MAEKSIYRPLEESGVDTATHVESNTNMGKKGKWLSALRKIFRFSKESRKTCKQNSPSLVDTEDPGAREKKNYKAARRSNVAKSTRQDSPPALGAQEQVSLQGDLGHDGNKNAVTVAAQLAAEEVLSSTHQSSYGRITKEERAAVKIQAAFRGYLARRGFRSFRGVMRLQALVRGHTVRKQATLTLRCMQALVRVQARVRTRRIRMSEDVQCEIWQKRQEEYLARKSVSDGSPQDWDDSVQTMEEMEAKKLNKHEAAIKRERALAYAFAHQLWRSAPKQASMYTDFEPDNPQHWGWSWIERWMAARPWEARMGDRESFSIKNIHGEPGKQKGGRKARSPAKTPCLVKTSGQSAIKTPLVGTPTAKPSAANDRSTKSRSSLTKDEEGSAISVATTSLHSVGPRCGSRYSSISGSSFRDDESLTSSATVPNYMNATKSAKAKNRSIISPKERPGTPDTDSISAKRRLSFPKNENSVSRPRSSRTSA